MVCGAFLGSPERFLTHLCLPAVSDRHCATPTSPQHVEATPLPLSADTHLGRLLSGSCSSVPG